LSNRAASLTVNHRSFGGLSFGIQNDGMNVNGPYSLACQYLAAARRILRSEAAPDAVLVAA
jgi:hypothetical protein